MADARVCLIGRKYPRRTRPELLDISHFQCFIHPDVCMMWLIVNFLLVHYLLCCISLFLASNGFLFYCLFISPINLRTSLMFTRSKVTSIKSCPLFLWMVTNHCASVVITKALYASGTLVSPSLKRRRRNSTRIRIGAIVAFMQWRIRVPTIFTPAVETD